MAEYKILAQEGCGFKCKKKKKIIFAGNRSKPALRSDVARGARVADAAERA